MVLKYLELLNQSSEFVTSLLKKLSPPLVTLLSAEPEIQYVALRNINIVVQKRLVFDSGFISITSRLEF